MAKTEFKKYRRKLNKKKKLKALAELIQRNDHNKEGIPKKPKSNAKHGIHKKDDCAERLRKNIQYPLNGQEVPTEVQPVFGEVNETQLKQLKKLLDQRLKLRLARPYLELNEIGKAADFTNPPEKRVPLTIDDFQHFIIFSLHGKMSTMGYSRFINIMQTNNIKHRIFVVIEGAGLKEYIENETNLATLKEFETKLEVVTPFSYGGNLIGELALVPMTRTQRNKIREEYGSIIGAMKEGEVYKSLRKIFKIKPNLNVGKLMPCPDKFSRTKLVLSPYEMLEENYPIPIRDSNNRKFSKYVPTRDEYEELTDNSPMWSVDCEMCLTTKGRNELTRVCIMNEQHEIVYETLVKPYNEITNYLTQYSGITKKMLQGVTTRLENVQQHIRKICPPDVIFIGQSLGSDLKALQMIHPYVIDTALIFNLSGVKHRKSKLKVLTEQFLSERIQTGEGGHNPIEDALAAMKLVQAKLQHSIGWGNAILSGERPESEHQAARLLLQARDEAGNSRLKGFVDYSSLIEDEEKNATISTSLMSHLVRYNKNVHLIGIADSINSWGTHYKPSDSIKETVVGSAKATIKVAKNESPEGGTTIAHIDLSTRSSQNAITKADKLIQKLLRNPLPGTLYSILLAGRPDRQGNGVLFLHNLKEHVPYVRLPGMT